MWVFYASLSALFAGIMAILAKIGLKAVDSTLATGLRTIVVVLFSWLIVLIVHSQNTIQDISTKSFIFLILSGLATGGSWLCYFKALQIGDINKVVVVDKSSTMLTMILSFLILKEPLSGMMIFAMILMGIGTYLMIEKKSQVLNQTTGYQWLFYAGLSAIFASLTAILGKIGIEGVESNLGTAIRTIVVLIVSWVMIFGQRKHYQLKQLDLKNWLFIFLSGLATGMSWLFYYRALQEGPASLVVPIDKLSIVVTVAFGYFILQERLKKRAVLGLFLVIVGTMLLLL